MSTLSRFRWVALQVFSGSAVIAALQAQPFEPSAMRPLLATLGHAADTAAGAPIDAYRDFYHLRFPGIVHHIGTFMSGSYELVGQQFMPPHPCGTVVMLHGYYDHAGILVNGIRYCLEQGYAVVLCDLPGHGLSSGERSSINDFGEYAQALEDLLFTLDGRLPQPLILSGHSTGCAAAVEYLFTRSASPFTHTILLAPLVHSAFWDLSKATWWIGRNFMQRTVRWFRTSSHDTSFLHWFRNDPLQDHSFPVRWSGALYAWNERLATCAPRQLPVTIIQGDRDETVDWRYNIPFLRTLVPGCRVVMIRGGRHQLLNELPRWREPVLEAIGGVLGEVRQSAKNEP